MKCLTNRVIYNKVYTLKRQSILNNCKIKGLRRNMGDIFIINNNTRSVKSQGHSSYIRKIWDNCQNFLSGDFPNGSGVCKFKELQVLNPNAECCKPAKLIQ
jgi:hypothetical protein